MTIFDNIAGEFKTRNFSIYGQWTGILSILICIAVGISTIFSFNLVLTIFAVLCIVTGLITIFLEIPLLLRICPTSAKFDEGIRKLHNNWGRAGFYMIASVVQWLSLLSKHGSSLIAAAVVLLFAGAFYALAAVKGQEFTGSKTLGGQGVAQMIV